MAALRNILINIVVLIGIALATDVLVVSEQNYPDSAVAYTVAEKYGYAVIVVDGFTVTQDQLKQIAEYNPENVYLIGGPAVISEDFENAIRNYNSSWTVTRIYGITKYGTSAEVAKKFFVSSDKAVIVTDKGDYPSEKGNYKLVTLASKLAGFYGIPLLITPEDTISGEILEALQVLGVKEVLLIGNASLKTQLENLNIKVTTLNELGIQNKIREKARERAGEVPLVIVCIKNATDSNAAALMSGHVLLVRGADEINITFVKEFSRVKVLGNPECAEQIYDKLNASGVKVESISGRKVYEICKNLVKEIKEEVKSRFENLNQTREKFIKAKAEEALKEAEEELNEVMTINCSKKIDINKLEERLNRAKDSYNKGKYGEAFGLATSVIAEIRNYYWKCRDEIDEVEIMREKEKVAFREYFKNLREKFKEVCKKVKVLNVNVSEINETEAEKNVSKIEKALNYCRIAENLLKKGLKIEEIKEALEKGNIEEISNFITGRQGVTPKPMSRQPY